MLSSDRSELRADHRRGPPAGGAYHGAPWDDDAQPFDPDAPWDDDAAEALMCLFESEEGRLSRPATRDRARARRPYSPLPAGSDAVEGGVDRAWLEAHLSEMAQQLKDALAEANPEPTLAALSGRLETIEQRFGATLGRAAQRADADALRAIETRVLDLAGQLEQARERLDRIGAMDTEVRALAHKIEEAGALRTSALEKLLRDLIAEWRQGEQRTAAALQHIEEAIGQLGEVVDAMEAAKPAPDLSVPPLTGAELGRGTAMGAGSRHAAAAGRPPVLFQAALDAADYAPKPFAGGPSAAVSDTAPAALGEAGQPARGRTGPKLSPGALRIMALRAKLRQSSGSGRVLPNFMQGGAPGERQGTFRRAGLGVMLVAGAAMLASSAYSLYRSLATATAAPAGTAVVAGEGRKTVRQ